VSYYSLNPEDLQDASGRVLYDMIGGGSIKNAAQASESLRKAGIPGIKYLDGGSRHLSGWEVGKSGRGGWVLKNNQLAPNQWQQFPTQEEANAAYKAMPDVGSRNYVVFPGNEDMLNILERNNQPLVNALRSK
jgi:hypothetical protein